jgi:hypothetical protein
MNVKFDFNILLPGSDSIYDDMDMSDLVPYLPQSASLLYYNASRPVTLGKNSENLFRWKMNGTSMQVEWDNPTLLQIWNDTSFTNSSGVATLPWANEWSYVVIETALTVPHPRLLRPRSGLWYIQRILGSR